MKQPSFSPHRKWICCLLFVASLLQPACVRAGSEKGEWRKSLNGIWQFTTNATAATLPAADWDAISVPGNWDVLTRYSTYVGKGRYQRAFTVPADWSGKHIRLHFDAVYEDTEVW